MYTFCIFCYRYLASGNSLTDIEEMYSVGQPTAGNIVRRVCTVIWDIMKEECIPIPTTEKWYEIVKCFETRAHFPHCIGAVDGKHIIIIRLYRSGSLFFNYKHYFSILLLALADSNYQFVCVDVGSYGKDSDCSIFKNSSLWTALVPKREQFCGVTSAVPYVIVGDEAFVLTNFLLTPYAGNDLSKKKVFNY
ncbi:hypothetical protein B7P43_G18008 [Cryptotermes secundus]|uniref:DDE Tnp4 domain-containing protein n=1 Tax=Cryptotermes secundus TaxID=105785 RepID=A0A2J7PT97_9NEOP|nr:hypothetical protein B7P43_G18008 [Cryptotermes secundus]